MKRSRRMIALLSVLVVVLIANFAIQKVFKDTQDVVQEQGTFALSGHDAQDITGLKWTRDGQEMEFYLSGGVWQYAYDPEYPADQDMISGLSETAGSLEAVRKLENAAVLSDYGLSEPAFTLEVSYDGGENVTYSLGDQTPFADGWYVASSNAENTVYVMENDFSGKFVTDLNEYAVMEELTEIENAVKISVGDSFHAEHRDESSLLDDSVKWYAQDDSGGLDAEKVETLVENALGLEFNALVNYSADEEELAGMNLTGDTAVRVSITDDAGAERTLLIGAISQEGEYYARLENSHMVYTLSGNAGEVVGAQTKDMLSLSVAPVAFEDVQEIVYTVNGADTLIARMETVVKATDEEALDKTEETVLINGETAQNDAAAALWALTAGLEATEYAPDEAKGEVVLTFSVVLENGKNGSFMLYEYDASFYRIESGDGREMLVEADDVDKIIRHVKQLAP